MSSFGNETDMFLGFERYVKNTAICVQAQTAFVYVGNRAFDVGNVSVIEV